MAEAKSRVTFFDKTDIECPCCTFTFKKEKLMRGGGRVIAGDLSDELRRNYKESKKYGYVNPLIYSPTVCPSCWYATLEPDFKLPNKKSLEGLRKAQEDRIKKMTSLFEGIPLDFSVERTLETGTASYILCTMCYSFFDPKLNPSAKRAISSIRIAWLLGDLEEKYKTQRFGYFQDYFYKKAHKYYNQTMDWAQNGKETLGDISLGPDTDKNYGYDGVVYLTSLLNFKLAFLEKDLRQRGEIYFKSKIMMAKIFGFGKSSKEKPSTLVNTARDLYEQVASYLKQIEDELGEKIG